MRYKIKFIFILMHSSLCYPFVSFYLFVCFFTIRLNKDIYAFCTSIVATVIIFDVTVRAVRLFVLSYIYLSIPNVCYCCCNLSCFDWCDCVMNVLGTTKHCTNSLCKYVEKSTFIGVHWVTDLFFPPVFSFFFFHPCFKFNCCCESLSTFCS